MSEFGMLLAFRDDSTSFVNGYEAGAIAEKMQSNVLLIDQGFEEGFPDHDENVELFERMASLWDYKLEIKPVGDGWTAIRLTYRGPDNAKPNLTVVK